MQVLSLRSKGGTDIINSLKGLYNYIHAQAWTHKPANMKNEVALKWDYDRML